jgi:hypothetical protein
MTHNEETLKAAKEFARQRPFHEASEFAFLAGCEYKQQEMEEYVKYRVAKALDFWKDFDENLQTEVDKDDSDTMSIGEFVLDYFDLWK